MAQEFIYGLYITDNMNDVKQLYQTYTNPISAIKQIIEFVNVNKYSTFANWFFNDVLLKNSTNVLDIIGFVKNNSSLSSNQYKQFEQLIAPHFDDYCLYLSAIYHESPNKTKKSDKMDILYPLFNEIKSLFDDMKLDFYEFQRIDTLIQKFNTHIKNCQKHIQIELLNKNICFYKTKQFDFKQLNINHSSNVEIQVSQNNITIGFGDYDYTIQTIKHIPN